MTEILIIFFDKSLDGCTVLFVSFEICEELRASTPIFVILLSVYVCKCHTNDDMSHSSMVGVHINPTLISCLAPAQKLFVYWGMCGLNVYTSCHGMTGWV